MFYLSFACIGIGFYWCSISFNHSKSFASMVDIQCHSHMYCSDKKSKKRSTLCATFFLIVVGEDANEKLGHKVDDLHSTEDGEAWTEKF